MNVLLINSGELLSPLRALGHVAFDFDQSACLDEHGRKRGEFSLDAAISAACFAPDLVVVQLFGPRLFLRGIEACPYPLVARVYDSSFNHFWLQDYLRLFDAVFVDFKSSVATLADVGIQARWLPFGIDPAKLPAQTPPWRYDIGFVGVTESRPRRQALLAALREQFRVGVAGALSGPGRLTPRQSAEHYASAPLAINECLYDGVNFRVFEAMASGSMLLTEATQNGLADLFEDGVHLATFTPENLLDRVRHYLAHDEERARIAAAGRSEVLARHTPAERTRHILESTRALHGQPRSRNVAERRGWSARAGYAFCRRWPHFVPEEYPRIETDLRAVIDAQPKHGPAHWTRGLVHGEMGDPRTAFFLLQKAAELLPHEPLVCFHLAHLLHGLEHLELAARTFATGLSRVAKCDPETRRSAEALLERRAFGPELWLALGRVLETSGRSPEPNAAPFDTPRFPLHAFEYYTRACREGEAGRGLVALGHAYAAAGDASVALGFYEAALAEGVRGPAVYLATGVQELRCFRRAEGLAHIEHALELEPGLAGEIVGLRLRPEERLRLNDVRARSLCGVAP